MMARTYLDWNATAPLRAKAKVAMIEAMNVVGNPSSVHQEGRAAKALLENARGQVANALGANAADIVFTSGATEAAGLALRGRGIDCGGIEHDAVLSWADATLRVDEHGAVSVPDVGSSAVQLANSETGILQNLPQGLALCDATQAFGKHPFGFDWSGAEMALVSSHKIGGPKGVGALVMKRGRDVDAQIKGGGQEMGWRSGTENLIGIAGFGAAAEAAAKDLADSVWDQVANLRDMLETVISDQAPDTVIVGKDTRRLPNTSCLVTPGWKGETQVMQMDLAGFAISAGSACSSGKVKASNVLQAMGFDQNDSASAIRVSLGPENTEDDVMRFAQTWLAARNKHRARAA